MSSKEMIYSILKKLDIPTVSYGFSDSLIFPKVIFFHVVSTHNRLSNNKVNKHSIYQINVYDKKPHDLEKSSILNEIERAFESETLNCGDWHEVINVNEDGKHEFMYYIEVYI